MWGIAIVVAGFCWWLGTTSWGRRRSRAKGLQTTSGAPTEKAIQTTLLIAGLGALVAILNRNWWWLAITLGALVVGLARYVAYRRTGRWR